MKKVLFLVQSCIPAIKHNEYFPILQNTIKSIINQKRRADIEIRIVITDDGSGYLKSFVDHSIDIQSLSLDNLLIIKNKYDLNVDEIICAPESEYFRKADLFNFYLRSKGSLYDLIIFLDDDHNFIKEDCLIRFISNYEKGYNFIVGRYYHPVYWFCTVNNGLYDWGIQGTTYAVSFPILKSIGFFSDSVKEWGFAEDYDIFRKAYLASLKHSVKAVFDSNIITVDNINGRWKYCVQKLGGFETGIKKFEQEHAITFKKAAIKMQDWMDVIPNDYGISELVMKKINLEELMKFESLLKDRKTSLFDINLFAIKRIIYKKASKLISLVTSTVFR
ncbi:MAG: hypothetical protein NW214_01140 [Pseudanabaenaceae cyanobacterium bins.39]|nr:hypothetical protein [Pseudanabaenaceae cyanobacterium bins.39]